MRDKHCKMVLACFPYFFHLWGYLGSTCYIMKYESGLYVLKQRALLEIHAGTVEMKICLSKSTNFIDKNKNLQESTRL